MNTKSIEVTVRNVYGVETVYPHCAGSKLFCRLAKTKTLTPYMIELIKAEGYDVRVVSQKAFL